MNLRAIQFNSFNNRLKAASYLNWTKFHAMEKTPKTLHSQINNPKGEVKNQTFQLGFLSHNPILISLFSTSKKSYQTRTSN